MKHVVTYRTTDWEYVKYPYPMFRCQVVYGEDYLERAFIPTKVSPTRRYYIYINSTKLLSTPEAQRLYASREEAEKVAKMMPIPRYHYYEVKTNNSMWYLPDGQFQVAKTKDGTVVIVPGKDDTDRCLAFIGTGVWRTTISEYTHDGCQILADVYAGNGRHYERHLAAIMEPGGYVRFRMATVQEQGYARYTWEGDKLEYSWTNQEEEDADTDNIIETL